MAAQPSDGAARAPEEVPAGEASPETLRRLEAALPALEPPVDAAAARADDRNAVVLLVVVAACIVAGAVSLLALLL